MGKSKTLMTRIHIRGRTNLRGVDHTQGDRFSLAHGVGQLYAQVALHVANGNSCLVSPTSAVEAALRGITTLLCEKFPKR